MEASDKNTKTALQRGSVPARRTTGAARFPVTRWSLVAGLADATAGEKERALGEICRNYWLPLYAFVRHQGHPQHDAEDLTQGFFAHLLSQQHLGYLSGVEGRMRSYLLGALKRFMIDEWRASTATKRGGKSKPLSLDSEEARLRYEEIQSPDDSPEVTFHRHWVLAVLGNARARLKARYAEGEKRALFEAIEGAITDTESIDYAEAAQQLGMTEGGLRTAVHRLRRRYGEAIRDEIADTVGEDDVEDEYRDLIHNYL